MSFLADVQPIFDKHCTGCHAGLKPAGALDFSAGLTSSGSAEEYSGLSPLKIERLLTQERTILPGYY